MSEAKFSAGQAFQSELGEQILDVNLQRQLQEQSVEFQRSLELAKLLKQVTDQVRSTLNSEVVLQTIVREVRSLLNTDRVVIYRFLEDWVGEVVVEEVIDPWERILGKTYEDTCFPEEHGQQYLEGRVRAIHNVVLSDLAPCHKNLLLKMQVQANLIVPIRMHQQIWGLLIAHECRAPRRWHPSETELLQQLADQAAIAIHQAELYEQSCIAAATAQAHAKRLEQTTQELAETLHDLQQTQSQLVQAEKLSSLGQLVAGVAHEINNPINFVHGNLHHVEDYTRSLLNVIEAYQEQCPQPHAKTQAAIEAAELEFLKEDLPKVVSSMQIGADRIRQIVQALQSFSRADQVEKKPIDLHTGIDSTLLILQHRLKPHSNRPGIQIIKKYGELPLVESYGGQLNQVFMNLLNNAIDVLEERDQQRTVTELETEPSQIIIQTSTNQTEEGLEAIVQIIDNGSGIPEAIRTRIFDPFFTTKPVGKGTGLGLSISHHIVVENHGGRLLCNSQPGQGTEFRLEVPVLARKS